LGCWPSIPQQVDGKTGNLGDKVSISREKAKVHVTVEVPYGPASLWKEEVDAREIRLVLCSGL